MKLDLRENMYVRFKDKRGIEYIRKIISVNNAYPDKLYAGIYIDKEANNSNGVSLKNIVKASYNIIDILKVGDYIKTERIDFIVKPDMCGDEELNEGKIHLASHDKCNFIYIKDIETIVTKEQFESIAYRI